MREENGFLITPIQFIEFVKSSTMITSTRTYQNIKINYILTNERKLCNIFLLGSTEQWGLESHSPKYVHIYTYFKSWIERVIAPASIRKNMYYREILYIRDSPTAYTGGWAGK